MSLLSMSLLSGIPMGGKKLSQPQRRQRCSGTRPGQSVKKSSTFHLKNKFQIQPLPPAFNAITMIPAPLLSLDSCRASYGLPASMPSSYSLFSTQHPKWCFCSIKQMPWDFSQCSHLTQS